MAARRSDGPVCRASARRSATRTSRSSFDTSAALPTRAESAKLLDAEQDELLALLADRELHAIARSGRDGIEEGRRRRNGHQPRGAQAAAPAVLDPDAPAPGDRVKLAVRQE